MSLNWVMLSPSTSPPFTPLSGEQTLYTSPPRIGLDISTPSHYPAKQQQPFSQTHSLGRLYLTNRRIIYLPDKSTDRIQSFAAPILNLHDSHVTAPFFGPNVWQALLQPVPSGGIPIPSGGVVELKLIFKDGGAFDFQSNYERVRERLQHAVAVSREEQGSRGPHAPLNNVNLSSVNLEDLPVYKEESDGPLLSPVSAVATSSNLRLSSMQPPGGAGPPTEPFHGQSEISHQHAAPPAGPPPDYEEAQRAGVEDQLGRRLGEQGP